MNSVNVLRRRLRVEWMQFGIGSTGALIRTLILWTPTHPCVLHRYRRPCISSTAQYGLLTLSIEEEGVLIKRCLKCRVRLGMPVSRGGTGESAVSRRHVTHPNDSRLLAGSANQHEERSIRCLSALLRETASHYPGQRCSQHYSYCRQRTPHKSSRRRTAR